MINFNVKIAPTCDLHTIGIISNKFLLLVPQGSPYWEAWGWASIDKKKIDSIFLSDPPPELPNLGGLR